MVYSFEHCRKMDVDLLWSEKSNQAENYTPSYRL